MHPQANDFIKSVKGKLPYFFSRQYVLECGSLNINGTARDFFTDCIYTGIDLGEGKDVDVICHAKDHLYPKSYGVVVSAEMLEHDKEWRESLLQMYANLDDNGLMLITCASPLRAEHGTTEYGAHNSPFTNGYYHGLTTEEIAGVLTKEMFTDYFLDYGNEGKDVYFYGVKK